MSRGQAGTEDSERAATTSQVIEECLNLTRPASFFLYAGAGSGKTRSLVEALEYVQTKWRHQLRLKGQQVAVITYTKAACEEIKRRIGHDPLVVVQTIHSFTWEQLVKGFTGDIKEWLSAELLADIAELKNKLAKGRPGTKTDATRRRSIESKTQRLESLSDIKCFVYNPDGDNRDRDSLNHAEVIKLASHFLTSKPTAQQLLVRKFPFLLIDESQDTNRVLMDALLELQKKHGELFSLGLFGDTMQRIYSDGKADLRTSLSEDWRTPELLANYRCPARIVRLINQIRSEVDDHQQEPRDVAGEGQVRLFIYDASVDRQIAESDVRSRMAELAKDELWRDSSEVKALTLEHHMAASRMGFAEMFDPLYRVDDYSTGLLDGSLSATRFFSKVVLPLKQAFMAGDRFRVASIVKRESPLLESGAILSAVGSQHEQLRSANEAVEGLRSVFDDKGVTFQQVLQYVTDKRLLSPPESLQPFIGEIDERESTSESAEGEADGNAAKIIAMRDFLESPFSQIELYDAYVSGDAAFDTHQGVKGLEFPRVLVVADDESARGFLFSYEKLFGVKPKSKTDIKNEAEGKETGVDRTRRLFYVTCSRAEKSLAVVAYSESPEKVKEYAIGSGWFDESEILVS